MEKPRRILFSGVILCADQEFQQEFQLFEGKVFRLHVIPDAASCGLIAATVRKLCISDKTGEVQCVSVHLAAVDDERQRLTIARSLVGHPHIVVLDDAASALDFATDARLRKALRALRSELTSVIVSQRVSAVMGADTILVLDHGRMAGLGTHEELLRTCPLYGEICASQLRGDEAARDQHSTEEVIHHG